MNRAGPRFCRFVVIADVFEVFAPAKGLDKEHAAAARHHEDVFDAFAGHPVNDVIGKPDHLAR